MNKLVFLQAKLMFVKQFLVKVSIAYIRGKLNIVFVNQVHKDISDFLYGNANCKL